MREIFAAALQSRVIIGERNRVSIRCLVDSRRREPPHGRILELFGRSLIE